MKVREMIGTSVRTMAKMKVTTDGDQHQDEGECDYRSMEERRTATSVRGQGVTDSVVTTCAVMVYSPV